MKYFCLDRDSCGFSRKLTEAEFDKEKFSEPFKNCTKCNYYMVLVPDDFSLEKLEDVIGGIRAVRKIYESNK